MAELVRDGSDPFTVTSTAIDLCRSVWNGGVWDQIAALDWEADRRHCRLWLRRLLESEPPGPSITGFWFGIFNPVRDGVAASDLYITGSNSYPSDDWLFESTWEPAGRYAVSPLLTTIHRLAAGSDAEALGVADYVLTFAHAGSAVNDFVDHLDREVMVGGAAARGIAIGHDSGDGLFLGELTPSGMDRSRASWI